MKKVIFCWCTGKGQNYRVGNCRAVGLQAAILGKGQLCWGQTHTGRSVIGGKSQALDCTPLEGG